MNTVLLKKRSGFTLLELLIVVAILAVLVALALPFYLDYVNQSRIAGAQADLRSYVKALQTYDQMEPVVFTATSPLSLIGKYMQDYRKSAVQIFPVDPWGNDYSFSVSEGTVLSFGSNGKNESAANLRFPAGDDLGATWKPEFFISDVQAKGLNALDVYFSRKVVSFLLAHITGTQLVGLNGATNVDLTGSTIAQISNNQYRISLAGPPIAPMVTLKSYTLTLNAVAAQDGKVIDGTDKNPNGGLATEFTFVAP